MKKILIILLFLSVILSGCAKNSDLTEKDDETVTDVSIKEAKDIKHMNQGYMNWK